MADARRLSRAGSATSSGRHSEGGGGGGAGLPRSPLREGALAASSPAGSPPPPPAAHPRDPLRERLEELHRHVEQVGLQFASQREAGLVRREDFERSRETMEATLRLARGVRARMMIGSTQRPLTPTALATPESEAVETFAALPRAGERAKLLARTLAEQGFQAIPQRTVERIGHNGEPGGECAVCLAAFRPGERQKLPPCGHRFHTRCLRKWLVTQLSGMCPMCRAPLGGATMLA